MILTIGFSIFLFLSLWAYFMFVGVMNFTQNLDNLEIPLPGRPARRTIGRINSDVEKSIWAILLPHAIFVLTFYGMLEYSQLLSDVLMAVLVVIGGVVVIFVMTPANRRAHAYMNIGQITIIHMVSSLSIFLTIGAIFNDKYLSYQEMGAFSLIILGAMMTYSRLVHRERKKGK